MNFFIVINVCVYEWCNKAVITAGMGDMLSGAIGKAAADKAADQAADQALNFGKNLFK